MLLAPAEDGHFASLNLAAPNPTGVIGGIIIGITAALLWQRYYRIKLPTWLAFFGGRRFVPIITAVAALILGSACLRLLFLVTITDFRQPAIQLR